MSAVAQSWPTFSLTDHAARRMGARAVSDQAIECALVYGRATWTRGARIFAIGRKEAERYRSSGIDLDPFDGVHVVTTPDGSILTVYRNRDLRGLREGRTRRR